MQIPHKFSISIPPILINHGILALLALLYTPLLFHWYDGWLNKSISIEHEYFSHGIIGLPFAAYLAWNHRQAWQKLPNSLHPVGGILLILAGIFYLTGIPDLLNLSFPILLAGLCLWLKGVLGLKLQGFPLLLVFFATPTEVPYLIAPYTLPLQSFIAHTAGFILQTIGIPVVVNHIYLSVGGSVVEVAPYCAGLKMLFTTLYIGLILLYWSGAIARRGTSCFFLFSAAAISVAANILRNTLLTLFHGTGQEGLFSWLHEGWGGDLYSGLMLIVLVPTLKLIEKLVMFVTNEPELPPSNFLEESARESQESLGNYD